MSTLKAFILALVFLTCQLSAQNSPLTVEIFSEESGVQEGRPFWIALHYTLEKGWHTYWKNPGDAGMAPQIQFNLPEGFKVEEILYPTPNRHENESLITYGYDDDFTILAKVAPPQSLQETNKIEVDLEWITCSGLSCLPGQAKMALTLSAVKSSPEKDSKVKEIFDRARGSIPLKSSITQAVMQGELVCLTLSTPPSKALFFSEESEDIDHTIEPVISGNQLILKAQAGNIKQLKGILVADGTSYHLDVPVIHSIATEVIGMADVPSTKTALADTSTTLLWILLFAFAGGLTLNLMPCVLPVLSFKIMGFVKMAGNSKKVLLMHASLFTLGVLASFWVLAGSLLALKSWGHSIGWGFQLQEPIFVAALALLIFTFGLSMLGVLEIGTKMASWAGQQSTSSKNELVSSFFSGILATAVATPCTGPFMGTALGAAVSMTWMPALSVFTTLGLGMASPYILVAVFPKLLFFIPKPGNWMVRFKEIVGFTLVATSLWLVWVFGLQTSVNSIAMLLCSFFLTAFACWIFGNWTTPVKKPWVRKIATFSALAIFAFGGYIAWQSTSLPSDNVQIQHSDWEPFNPERVKTLHEQGIPVFIDFTAKWCLTCQTNHLALSTSSVQEEMNRLGVVKMKADWTKKDAIIAKELEKHGRSGVPLYILYGSNPKSAPVILPQTLTPDMVIKYLNENIPNNVE